MAKEKDNNNNDKVSKDGKLDKYDEVVPNLLMLGHWEQVSP